MRVWERGAGATLACGTGACAALAAAWRLRRVPAPRARVHLPGGSVEVEQDASGALWLTGPATRVAEGRFDPDLILDEMGHGPGTHAQPGHRAVGDVDHVNARLLEHLRGGDHSLRGEAARRGHFYRQDEFARRQFAGQFGRLFGRRNLVVGIRRGHGDDHGL